MQKKKKLFVFRVGTVGRQAVQGLQTKFNHVRVVNNTVLQSPTLSADTFVT